MTTIAADFFINLLMITPPSLSGSSTTVWQSCDHERSEFHKGIIFSPMWLPNKPQNSCVRNDVGSEWFILVRRLEVCVKGVFVNFKFGLPGIIMLFSGLSITIISPARAVYKLIALVRSLV